MDTEKNPPMSYHGIIAIIVITGLEISLEQKDVTKEAIARIKETFPGIEAQGDIGEPFSGLPIQCLGIAYEDGERGLAAKKSIVEDFLQQHINEIISKTFGDAGIKPFLTSFVRPD